MKKFEELVAGNCVVVTEDGKQYKGIYNTKLELVFACIPSHKKIMGYLQE